MPFRLRVQPEHPLEPLAEQGRFLLGLLHQRQQEKKEEAYRDRQEARAERQEDRLDEAAARVAEQDALNRAMMIAEMERQGFEYEPGGKQPGKYPIFEPGKTAQDELRDAIGRRITEPIQEPATPMVMMYDERGVPILDSAEIRRRAGGKYAEQQEQYEAELQQRERLRPRELPAAPIEFEQGPSFQYNPALALQMADQAPAYVQQQRELQRELDRREQLASMIEQNRGNLPAWIPEAIRQGYAGEGFVTAVMREMFDASSTGALTAQDTHRGRLEAWRQALILIRTRSTEEGFMGRRRPLDEVIDEVANAFGFDPQHLRKGYVYLMNYGTIPEPDMWQETRGAGGNNLWGQVWNQFQAGGGGSATPSAAPPAAAPAPAPAPAPDVSQSFGTGEVDAILEQAGEAPDGQVRTALRRAGYNSDQIEYIIGKRRR